jgi:hypothetical protein
MQCKSNVFRKLGFGFVLAVFSAGSLAGCGDDGPAVVANPQTISFGAAPSLPLGGAATVTASAGSGLAVRFSSSTPTVCSVDSSTGVVKDLAIGICIIAADQSGNSLYAPAPQVTQTLPVLFDSNQTITFGAVPTLTLFGAASVSATASSGRAVKYSSITPTVCTVDAGTGVVTDLTVGACSITAHQAGDANFNPAQQVTQTLTVSAPPGLTVPGAPTGVTATAGSASNTVTVGIGATDSGGSPIFGYTVVSSPSGITASGDASPVTVTCPATCAGYAFSVVAANAIGSSPPSALADVITTYNVKELFHEPDTQPNDSIFIGTFTFNSTTGAVSGLRGILSESMTGGANGYPNDTMNWLPLNYQLSATPATLGGVNGLLVTTFKNNNTNTFTTTFGGDGWSPQTGVDAGGVYYGFPKPANNPGNAYAIIFVTTANPTAALTQAQIDKLAYADCAPGGMMGAVGMTGTTAAGYGAIGTMSGYPVSLVITKQP